MKRFYAKHNVTETWYVKIMFSKTNIAEARKPVLKINHNQCLAVSCGASWDQCAKPNPPEMPWNFCWFPTQSTWYMTESMGQKEDKRLCENFCRSLYLLFFWVFSIQKAHYNQNHIIPKHRMKALYNVVHEFGAIIWYLCVDEHQIMPVGYIPATTLTEGQTNRI